MQPAPENKTRLRAVMDGLAGPAAVFYLMPLLMALLVAGTVAQKYMGLYAAHQKFFASFMFWAGPVPLPGGYTLIGIFTLCLILRFIFKTDWTWRKSGIHLAHLGALVLLLGGLVTAIAQKEGALVIPEGKAKGFVSDYYQREMLIVKNGDVHARVPFEKLRPGKALKQADVPFALIVTDKCRNCEITERGDEAGAFQSMAQFMKLNTAPLETEDEQNLSGVTIKIQGVSEEQDGAYVLFEAMPEPVTLKTENGDTFEVMFGKAQRALPFGVKLKDFVKETYPGTNKAKGYYSDIVIMEEGGNWPARIEMNKPLRYHGYTLFQSSFIENEEDGQVTVLAVVKNEGWLFPYIGTALMAFGLLWHALLMWATGRRRL